jgi:hypothetical protein
MKNTNVRIKINIIKSIVEMKQLITNYQDRVKHFLIDVNYILIKQIFLDGRRKPKNYNKRL